MALFPGAQGNDVLTWRAVADLVNRMHERISGERSDMLSGEELPLLREVQDRLEQELSFEEEFSVRFAGRLDAVEKEKNNLLPLREELGRMAHDYFTHRRSVMAFHRLCASMRKSLVRRSLGFAEEWMTHHGFGPAPGRYCWFALGYSGRGEGTVYGDCENVLVHDDISQDRNPYFQVFARKSEEILLQLGLHSRVSAALAHFSWQGTITEWRMRVTQGVTGKRNQEELSALAALADMSLLHGDEGLAGEMLNLVRGMLSFHHEILRTVARATSEMQTGLDFFGRLRVERSGRHRGMFNVEQLALEPLVGNIRVLAVKSGITASNTVERINELLVRGALSVELAERLLLAFHDFTCHRILIEIKDREADQWLDMEQLADGDEQRLKADLEAVVNLQRIVYQSVTEHG